MNKKINKIMLNTKVNFLFGAGVSRFNVKNPFPLMYDLVRIVVEDDEYEKYKKDLNGTNFNQVIGDILSNYFESDNADIEEGISKLEGLVPYCIDDSCKSKLLEFISWIKTKIIVSFQNCDIYESSKLLGEFYRNLILFNNAKISPLRRINVFTTNYDMLNELALEQNKIYYYSGFSGLCKRTFNLALYNYQYSENLGLYNRERNSFISQINLYKLHGSFSWKLENDELVEIQDFNKNTNPVIIHPSSSKYYSTNMITYYSALFREFSNEIIKENSSLIVIGSGLNDDHINKIISDAIALPTFTLIILCYCEAGKEQETINKMESKFGKKGNVIIDASPNNTIENLSKSLFNDEGIKNEG